LPLDRRTGQSQRTTGKLDEAQDRRDDQDAEAQPEVSRKGEATGSYHEDASRGAAPLPHGGAPPGHPRTAQRRHRESFRTAVLPDARYVFDMFHDGFYGPSNFTKRPSINLMGY
jgi:hypothetical protein